ncbi:MAG: hypothetical protein LBE35_04185 [Clostridiales bacterium]|jgi:uncharacterized membrane protein YczE|nr:hypothetical protein [Clostridiales bacterium]
MLKRIVIYIIGLQVVAFGSAFAIASDLGVSPMAALPYVLALATPLSIGFLSSLKFLIFISLQILILRKQFRIFDLIQIAFAFAFGFLLEFAIFALGNLQFPTYFGRLGMLAISIFLISVGLVLILAARIVALPPEALCVAAERRWPKFKFHLAKMALDSFLALSALTISLIALGGLFGVREGTIISAVAIGRTIPFVKKMLNPVLSRIFKEEKNE